MTEHQVAYLWTFDDYQQRLQHENYFVRHWAYDRIAKQYPDQQTQAAALLIGDSNRQLNSEAIKALGKLGGADHEQTLLAMRPNAAPNQHAWITLALAEMHSAIFLPQLLAEVQALDLTTNTRSHFTTYAAVESLGFYNDPAAIALLWQLLETYPSDDTFTGHVVAALLKHPAATTLPQILQRWSVLQRAAQRQPQVGNALATVIEQRQLFEGLPYETNLRAQWTMIEEWFEQPLARPAAVEAAIAADTMPEPSALLAAYWQAMQTTAAARGDHPAAWIAAWSVGDPPIGYQARTIYCWQALETLATLPVTAIHGAHQTEFVTLGTVLLAHYLVDENDEQRLAELQGDDARSAARLAILASPRKVVLTTVEDQVAALGPAVIPNLVDLLQDDRLWPTVRALRVITKIARAHPGSADDAADAVLQLLRDDDQGDYVAEAAQDALIAIGPAVIAPAAANWPDELTYDIFVTHALANIPVQAAVDLVEEKIRSNGTLREMDWENLVDLGQLQSIDLIRAHFDGEHPHMATALYTIGAIHDFDDPAMALWGRLARAEEERLEAIHHAMETGAPMPPVPEVLRRNNPLAHLDSLFADRFDDEFDEGVDEEDRQAPTQSLTAERKAKKKKRAMAKATKKAQRKGKKKKKR